METKSISRRQVAALAFLAMGASPAASLAKTGEAGAVAEAVAALAKAMLGADKAKLESLVSAPWSYGASAAGSKASPELA